MKPIVLYEANESTFTSNGLGTLDEAITAVITEELNGIYEMQFTYPVTGKKFSEIKYSRIIKAIASPGGNYQLFRIYSISKVINGIITVNAEHISYQLAYIPVNPFTATSVVEAMAKLSANAMSECPFTFWTDKQTTANYNQTEPSNIRARLAGTSGSILDVYGGEYEFDNYTVKLHNHRGQNRNVTLRYGKNITNIKQDENIASTYTSIVGFWKSDDVVVKTGVIDSEHVSSYPFKRVKVVDFSESYDSAPSIEQLTSKATSYMSANNFGIPKVNIKVSFVALWQTEEYKNIAVLERVYLGDTVSVFYEKLGITASAKVVSTKYNVLLDRYENIELGSMRSRLSDKLAKQDAEIKEQITDAKTALEKAVERVTELIAGGTGGHVVLNTDANGKMQEILVMDTEDINTATKVWRWNINGLGYSSTGYNGQYGTAITMDGSIVADFITTGTMTANRIRAGLLEDETGTNYWNLSTGEMRISTGTKIGAGNDTFQSIINGIQNQIDGSITSWFYNYAPSISNAPANGWNTVDKRKVHVGDLFYNSSTGYCYRWQIKPNIANPGLNDFEWVRISDEDISAALQAANDAKDTADGKRRVFVTTPVPPYDVGDLWAQGASGDLMRCATAKTAGQSYSASDWVKASKYTDDSALTTFLQNTYANDKQALENQIDKKAETWYQSTNPANSWTTNAVKAEHVGDLWYNTSNNTTWYYKATTTNGTTSYSWEQQKVPKAVFDEIDGKKRVFVATPNPPYDVGDLWVQGTSGDLLRCATAKASGQSYNANDWVKATKYTDDSALTNFLQSTYANDIQSLENQIDKKAETWYQGTNPADSWTTNAIKAEHVGDLWYNTTNNTTWYYKATTTNGTTTYEWEQQNVPKAVFDEIDGKKRVFVSTPTVPYDVGDLWVQGTNGDLLRCATAKKNNQSYAASDWVKATKYTDDTTANAVRSELTVVDGKITSEVTRATQAENSLSSRITQTANEIQTNVTKSQKKLFANYVGNGSPYDIIFEDGTEKEHIGEVYYDQTNDKYYRYTATRHVNNGALKIVFNSNSQTEANHDKITFCFVDETNIGGDDISITGTDYITGAPISGNIGGQTYYFPYTNSTKRIYFYSDGSAVYRGYKIDSIERVDEMDVTYSASTNESGWPTPPQGTYSQNQSYRFSTPNFSSGSNYGNNVRVYGEYKAADIPDRRTTTEYYTYGWELIDTSTSVFATVSSQIRQTAEEIQLKVSADEVVSAINLSADAIKLETAGRIIITAGNFQVDENGNVTANNARLTGANIDGTLTTGGANGSKIQIDAGTIKGFYNNAQLFTIQSAYDSANRAAELSINSTYIEVVGSQQIVIDGKTILLGSVLTNHAKVEIDVNGNEIYLETGQLNINGHVGYTGDIQAGEANLSFFNGILYSVNTGGDDIIIIG